MEKSIQESRTPEDFICLDCPSGGRMELTRLEHFTDRDRDFFLTAIKEDLDTDITMALDMILNDKADIWRWTKGNDRVLIMTQVVGKSLFMWSIAGEGYVKNLTEIAECLRIIARKLGLRSVRGICQRRLADVYLSRVDAKETGVVIEIGV